MNKTKVWTPNGYQVGPINSLVGKGESIIDYTNGTGTLVTKGKVGVDNQPSSVKQNDSNVIAGNDIDWTTGVKFSDQIAPLTAKLQMYNNIEKTTGKNYNMSSLSKQTVQLQKQQIDKAKAPLLSQMKNITDRQQIQHDIQGSVENMKKYDSGKSSSYFYSRIGNGKVPNSWLTSARLIPALTETAMLNHWLSNKPKGANIYSQNTYAPLALQTLAASRISPYPMIQAAKLADRQGMYSINKSGGYTGAQRQNARIAQNLGTQRNIANILQNAEEKNIAYRNAWAQAALQAGESDAARRQSAKQYNWETYNKAHGAKTKGIETHVANLGAMWQKYWADRIKNKQYEDTLSLYQQDLDNRKLALKRLLGGDNLGNDNLTKTKDSAPNNANSATLSKYNILNQYYTPDSLGGYKFSINNPYTYPNSLPAGQRIGRYGSMPDFMPIGDNRNRGKINTPNFNYPIMTSARMNKKPNQMMWNPNLGTITTNDDTNGYMLFDNQQDLDNFNTRMNNVRNASFDDYMPGGAYYDKGASGILFDNILPGFYANKRNRTSKYTGPI